MSIIETYKALVPHIIKESDEIVAVAFLHLDCGCIKICKVPDNGELIEMVFLNPIKDIEIPICVKCEKDEGSIYRMIAYEIMWTDDEGKIPNEEEKLAIMRKAFGDDLLALGVLKI